VKKKPYVVVITLNWNAKEHTIRCLKSILEMDYPNFDVILVDNGSTDGTVEAVRKKFPHIRVIANPQNLGYAKGFNIGLKEAYNMGAEYFLVMNNDTVIDKKALTHLVESAQNHPDVGFVTGKVYFYDRPNTLQTVGREAHPYRIIGPHIGAREEDKGQYDTPTYRDFIDDVFWLITREAFEKTRGYDPVFFLYFEETDWCIRAKKAGFKLFYTPKAKLWHNTTKKNNAKQLYFLRKNEVVFQYRHSELSSFIVYTLIHILLPGPRRVLSLAKRGRFREIIAYVGGVVQGYVEILRHPFQLKNIKREASS